MCGIAGYYSLKNIFSETDLRAMLSTIEHRGPDADGIENFGSCAIGHKRLSIIDLSENANQPMNSMNGRYSISYNGEVYNYFEMSRELGLTPKTSSDTEIVLETFAKWKNESFELFNGMFAIAIFDREEKKLSLVRDRMGIKPLYYFWDGQNLAFASELKELIAVPYIKKNISINVEAVNQYLHIGYVPEPNSIYTNIYKLPSGSYLEFDGKKIEITQYWTLQENVQSEIITDYYQAKEILRDLVEASVRYRLKSDVAFGTFLSGGIDSSLVSAMAQRNLGTQLKTFSIGFEEAKHNESDYAKKVASFLKTDHHELIAKEKDAIELAPQLVNVYDEPFADSSAIPTMLVSKMAKQHVTMTLSGDGGDELFHGYGAYMWAERLHAGKFKTFRKPMKTAFSFLNSRYKRVSKLLSIEKQEHIKSHIFSQEQYFFTRNEIANILQSEKQKNFNLNENYSFNGRNFTPAEAQAYFDLNYYLKDDLLVKVDRASMNYSLETRVPLLDYTIVEFALNVSPQLKTKNGTQKFILKELLYDYIPAELFNRPKWGFSIPLHKWLKTDLRYLAETYLSEEICRKYNFINAKQATDLKKKYFSGRYDYLYNRIWQIIVLHQFLEKMR